MAKKFLSRELIATVAFQMIDEGGMDSFSVRQVASKLGVQVSSLYNHIDNEYDVLLEVAKLAANMYPNYINEKVAGLPLDEATNKAGFAFRDFVKEHKHLYLLLLDQRFIGDPEFEEATRSFVQPIYAILEQYGITDKKEMDNLYIIMRTVTHGFATLDILGTFDHLSIDSGEAYRKINESVIDMMKNLGKKEAE